MSKLDSIGTYIFEVLESGLTTTKNGFPQWVARLKAAKKWIDAPEEMKHFSLEAPAYVDWSSFDEDIVAFMVLFKSKDEFSKDTALLNYEQLQLATGWDGTEFDSLINGTMVGKSILGRVGTNEYEGKTSLRVDWIDSPDSSPERTLKTLDAAEVKGLAAKLKITKTVKPAAPAKPATKPAVTKPVPTPATPTTNPPSVAGVAAASAPVAPIAVGTSSPKDTAPAAPKPPAKKKTVAPTPPPVEEKGEDTTTTAALPTELSQGEAWDYVIAHKGGNSDTVMEEAWIAACEEVLGTRDEDSATREEWAKVRDTVIKDCVLTK